MLAHGIPRWDGTFDGATIDQPPLARHSAAKILDEGDEPGLVMEHPCLQVFDDTIEFFVATALHGCSETGEVEGALSESDQPTFGVTGDSDRLLDPRRHGIPCRGILCDPSGLKGREDQGGEKRGDISWKNLEESTCKCAEVVCLTEDANK